MRRRRERAPPPLSLRLSLYLYLSVISVVHFPSPLTNGSGTHISHRSSVFVPSRLWRVDMSRLWRVDMSRLWRVDVLLFDMVNMKEWQARPARHAKATRPCAAMSWRPATKSVSPQCDNPENVDISGHLRTFADVSMATRSRFCGESTS